MDPRRFLIAGAAALALVPSLTGCVLTRQDAAAAVVVDASSAAAADPAAAGAAMQEAGGEISAAPVPLGPQGPPAPVPITPAPPEPQESRQPVTPHVGEPYMAWAQDTPVLEGRAALVAAGQAARARSRSDAFAGGVQVFGWSPGRLYEIWTAPLRVTTLTLAPGEAVTALAAGDTVRWQIAEAPSGSADAASGAPGEGRRSHVLVKPLETGLETNLVLTTTERVYLITLRSGRAADGFNAAVAWDVPPRAAPPPPPPPPPPEPLRLSPAEPEGPIHARYRIEPRGRSPGWSPVAVFDDGTRTFITLAPEARRQDSPALFVLSASGEAELANYRQSEGVLVVDRVFERAELRLGVRRPQVVRLTRLESDR